MMTLKSLEFSLVLLPVSCPLMAAEQGKGAISLVRPLPGQSVGFALEEVTVLMGWAVAEQTAPSLLPEPGNRVGPHTPPSWQH